MNILYIPFSLNLGGANKTLFTIGKEIRKRGHNVFFASSSGLLQTQLTNLDIPFYEIPTARRIPSLEMTKKISKIILTHKIDLICTVDFDTTMHSIFASYLIRKPIFATYASLFLTPYPFPWLPKLNVFSQEVVEKLIREYFWKRENFSNIIARIDGEIFNKNLNVRDLKIKLKIDNNDFLFLMVCRQDNSKIGGINYLLDCANEIYNSIENAKIVLFGSGNRREDILKKVSDLNKKIGKEFIIAPGEIIEIEKAFAMANIIIANGARSALEGMACGKPILSIGSNGFCGVINKESVESFRRFNFDKGKLLGNSISDKKYFIDMIIKIKNNPKLYQDLCEFSYDYSKKNLIIQNCVEEYEKEYIDLLNMKFNWKKILFSYALTILLFYKNRLKEKINKNNIKWRSNLEYPKGNLNPEWEKGLIADA